MFGKKDPKTEGPDQANESLYRRMTHRKPGEGNKDPLEQALANVQVGEPIADEREGAKSAHAVFASEEAGQKKDPYTESSTIREFLEDASRKGQQEPEQPERPVWENRPPARPTIKATDERKMASVFDAWMKPASFYGGEEKLTQEEQQAFQEENARRAKQQEMLEAAFLREETRPPLLRPEISQPTPAESAPAPKPVAPVSEPMAPAPAEPAKPAEQVEIPEPVATPTPTPTPAPTTPTPITPAPEPVTPAPEAPAPASAEPAKPAADEHLFGRRRRRQQALREQEAREAAERVAAAAESAKETEPAKPEEPVKVPEPAKPAEPVKQEEPKRPTVPERPAMPETPARRPSILDQDPSNVSLRRPAGEGDTTLLVGRRRERAPETGMTPPKAPETPVRPKPQEFTVSSNVLSNIDKPQEPPRAQRPVSRPENKEEKPAPPKAPAPSAPKPSAAIPAAAVTAAAVGAKIAAEPKKPATAIPGQEIPAMPVPPMTPAKPLVKKAAPARPKAPETPARPEPAKPAAPTVMPQSAPKATAPQPAPTVPQPAPTVPAAPKAELVQKPVETPAVKPAQKPVEAPTEKPAPQPVEATADTPVAKPVQQPVAEPKAAPAPQQETVPVPTPAEPAPTAEPAEEPQKYEPPSLAEMMAKAIKDTPPAPQVPRTAEPQPEPEEPIHEDELFLDDDQVEALTEDDLLTELIVPDEEELLPSHIVTPEEEAAKAAQQAAAAGTVPTDTTAQPETGVTAVGATQGEATPAAAAAAIAATAAPSADKTGGVAADSKQAPAADAAGTSATVAKTGEVKASEKVPLSRNTGRLGLPLKEEAPVDPRQQKLEEAKRAKKAAQRKREWTPRKIGIWLLVLLLLIGGGVGFGFFVKQRATANPITQDPNATEISLDLLHMTLPPEFLVNGDYYQTFERAVVSEQIFLGKENMGTQVDDAGMMQFYMEKIKKDKAFKDVSAMEAYPTDNVMAPMQHCTATMQLSGRDEKTDVDFLIIPYKTDIYYVVYSRQENVTSRFKDLAGTVYIEGEEAPPKQDQGDGKEGSQSIESYIEGSYTVGKEMPEGVYLAVSNDEYGGLVTVESKAKNGSTITVFQEAFYTNTYIEVKKKEKVTVSNATVYPLTANVTLDQSQPGMFKVGRDIEPGKYKIKSVGNDKGYYEVTKTGRHSIDDIINNQNFTGEKTIELKKDQYLLLKRAVLVK